MNSNQVARIGSDEMLAVLAEGCDERIFIDPDTGRNRYHLNPVKFDTLLERGSCTAGTLTRRSYSVAKAFLSKYDDLDYMTLVETQAERLRRLVQNETDDPCDVFFGPSGSDLMYYPLLFQRLLNPDKRLVSIVSCVEELGSGSRLAAAARFHADYNQFGDRVAKGEFIDPEHIPEVQYLDARCEQGSILDRGPLVRQTITRNREAAIVGNLVFGSKSGIKDDLALIDPDDGVMWTVDLCQFRVDRKLIHTLLHKGAMVMLTGSKFFQAPPFCAALLVPRKWTEKLRATDPDVIRPYGKLFSAADIPGDLPNLREKLPNRENKGLRLRMEIALDEMEAYAYWSNSQTNDLIARWSRAVKERLADRPCFELMPDQDKTNDSIISFQVWINDRALNNDELKDLFKVIATSEYEGFSNGINRVFIGQPVSYGDRSFIRLAIGSWSVRNLLEKNSLDLENDYRAIEIIETEARRMFG